MMTRDGPMTLDEGAAYFGVSKALLRCWTSSRALNRVRIGTWGDCRLRQAGLDEYVRKSTFTGLKASRNTSAED